MKRILSLSLLAAFLTFGVGANVASASTNSSTAVRAEANTTYAAPAAQRWGRRARTRIVTRNVRQGWHLYRVTYRITTFPNGRTSSTIINRVRIR
jgi:lipopolysaccharide export LptBFGC system permease protein LptF